MFLFRRKSLPSELSRLKYSRPFSPGENWNRGVTLHGPIFCLCDVERDIRRQSNSLAPTTPRHTETCTEDIIAAEKKYSLLFAVSNIYATFWVRFYFQTSPLSHIFELNTRAQCH